MSSEPGYRHEMKYEITYGDYLQLRSRLMSVMRIDSHAGTDGTYEICSLYFDNYQDKSLWEKLDGVQKRDKFRIRYYDHNLSFIVLEKKSKHNHLCLKSSCRISKEECRHILDGEMEWLSSCDDDRKLLHELYDACHYGQMRPKTIVSYKRQALIYEPGNVRVTFDMDIRSGLYHTDFLDTAYPLMPVLTDHMIMEVKYDEFLPDIIRLLLQTGSARVGAYSKYAASRSYE